MRGACLLADHDCFHAIDFPDLRISFRNHDPLFSFDHDSLDLVFCVFDSIFVCVSSSSRPPDLD